MASNPAVSSDLPSIDVVIVSWNVAPLLQKCLSSIFATRYPRLQVIVVDNASTDASITVIKSFSSVKLLANSQNIGLTRALNQGLQFCQGDYLLWLNPDAWLPKTFFTQALATASLFPRLGVLGPKLVSPDGSPQGSVFREPSLVNTIKEYWLNAGPLTQKYLPQTSHPVAVDIVSGACFFVTRAALSAVGKFTEKVFMYYEEFDYCRRVRQQGFQVIYDPGISVVHAHGQSTIQTSQAKYRYYLETLIYPLRLLLNWPNRLPASRRYLNESKIVYNGWFKEVLMTTVIWLAQKLKRSTA